jgi:hypothetical protein
MVPAGKQYHNKLLPLHATLARQIRRDSPAGKTIQTNPGKDRHKSLQVLVTSTPSRKLYFLFGADIALLSASLNNTFYPVFWDVINNQPRAFQLAMYQWTSTIWGAGNKTWMLIKKIVLLLRRRF